MSNIKPFHYQAYCKKVTDGDTIVVDIDLGFGTWRKDVTLRLARIDAPEKRGPEKDKGIPAMHYLQSLLDNKQIIVHTIKCDSWKRWISEVWVVDKKYNPLYNISDFMVSQNHAVYKDYK